MTGPDQICLVATVRCNLRCLNCYSWDVPQRTELTTEQLRDLLGALRDWLGPSAPEAGGPRTWEVYWAGGEPFVRPDLVSLLELCRDLGIWSQVTTNGTRIDEDRARAIIDAELGAIGISIDGARPATHDYIRGREGTFARAWGAVETLARLTEARGAATQVQVHTLLSGFYPEEALAVLDLVERTPGVLNVIYQALVSSCFREAPERWWEDHPFWPRDLAALDRVFDRIFERKRASDAAGRHVVGNSEAQLELVRRYFHDPTRRVPGRCTVGEHSFNVDSNGDVRICHFMAPIGNVLESPPREIWEGARAQKTRRAIDRCHHNCNLMNCNWFEDGLEGAEALLAGWEQA